MPQILASAANPLGDDPDSKWWQDAEAPFLALGVLPVGLLLLAKYAPFPVELKHVIIVQAAMPAGVISIIVSKLYGGHPRTAVQIVLGTTALGVLVIPLWLRAGLAWVGK